MGCGVIIASFYHSEIDAAVHATTFGCGVVCNGAVLAES